MRNLLQHPLTADEVQKVLSNQMQAIADRQTIGGIDGLALARVADFLQQNDAQFREFLKQGQ